MPDASAREPQATLEPASRVRNQAHDDETPAHVTYEPQTRRRAPQTAWRTDFDGTAPEDWAGPPDLRSGVPQEQTAATLLTGWREFTQLWRDERVNEVHIRGTRVTVSGVLGVYSMPGFSSLGAARQAIEGITATRAEIGADVLRIGDSIVVTRRQLVSPNTAWLVTAGILTEEQLAQVKTALDHTRAVTLTGAAAPVIMRSLAALIPAGSRVFEAPYGVLPAWCVTAASPLDADYVIGVRPGQLAEKMAATSQIGALIANPETEFTAAVHLNVSGRSTAPGKVTTR